MAVRSAPVPAEERQRRLVRASQRYMSGSLSAEDFEAQERLYMVDYRAAAIEVARSRRSRWAGRKARRV